MLSISSAEIPAANRQIIGITLTGSAGRFVAISNRLDGSGEAQMDPRAIQLFRLSNEGDVPEVRLIKEFLQPELSRTFRIDENDDMLSWYGLRFLDDTDSMPQIPYAFRNEAQLSDYPFPENFKDVYLLDLFPGRKGRRGQSLMVDSNGRHIVIKTMEGFVVQLWQQEDVLKEVALPRSELREVNRRNDNAGDVLFISEQAVVFGLNEEWTSLSEKPEYDWIQQHSEIVKEVFQYPSFRMVVATELAALLDRESRKIHVLLRSGEAAELDMFSSADQTPAGRRRTDQDHIQDLKYPNLILKERSELAINQVSLDCSMMVLDEGSIALIDTDYQRVLVVSPKADVE